ncbi:hypothetical protein [Paenibacillus sp. KS-LC4]|uniref:hypothetical protein n=1 Tax=Paenibacillus sp. KS-LC4 TaxID=2979727 RepID=UPI0030CF9EC8
MVIKGSEWILSKKFISFLLIMTLVFSNAVSVVFAENSNIHVISDETEFKTIEGEILGSVTTVTTIERSEGSQGVKNVITESKKFNLNPEYENNKNYTEIFTDTLTVNTIFATYDYKVYVNGELMNDKEPSMGLRAIDKAGIPSVCHYYSNNSMTSYTFACYESMNYNWVGDHAKPDPEGSNIQKQATASNQWFATAKNGVDLFAMQFSTFDTALMSLWIEVGGTIAALSWSTIGAIIVGGGVAALLAGNVVNQWSSAKSYLGNAYSYIGKL